MIEWVIVTPQPIRAMFAPLCGLQFVFLLELASPLQLFLLRGSFLKKNNHDYYYIIHICFIIVYIYIIVKLYNNIYVIM